jgi:hypothetical protein
VHVWLVDTPVNQAGARAVGAARDGVYRSDRGVTTFKFHPEPSFLRGIADIVVEHHPRADRIELFGLITSGGLIDAMERHGFRCVSEAGEEPVTYVRAG